MDDSSKSGYIMIVLRDLLITLGLNLKFPKHVIKGGESPFEGSVSPIIDLGLYYFKGLKAGKITTE